MSGPVSRETPSPPDVAAKVFARSLPLAQHYAELLAGPGVVRGLIGPREAPRLWDRHLLNCALLGAALPAKADVCDVGSGAGLPGLVLALVRPDLRVTLVEPLLRRTEFLTEAVTELGLANVEVVRARAEALHGEREFCVVTARAVAPLDKLLAWSMPLVRRGGELVAMKGTTVRQEVAEAAGALARTGAVDARVEEYGVGLVDPPTTVVRVRASRPSGLGSDDRTRRREARVVRSRGKRGGRR